MPYKHLYGTQVTTRKSPQYQEEAFAFFDNNYGHGVVRDGLAVQQQLKSYEAVHSKENGEMEMIIPYHAAIFAIVGQQDENVPVASDTMC